MTESTPSAVVVQRVLPAPPGEVYDEWLDADGLTEWMCPRPARAVRVEVDPRVGGAFRIEMEEAGVFSAIAGEYLVLERPQLLRFSWRVSSWSATDAESVVTVTFELHGRDETLMTINHTLLPSGRPPDYERGWAAIAEQLAGAIEARR